MAPPKTGIRTPRARKRVGSAPARSAHVKVLSPPVPTVSPASPRVPVELLSDDDGQLVLPIRFQCPLCFDVLRAPIQLPCCARHLCQECFERALEITSANCGFCRKRIVGLARKKQYAVDETLWTEIRRCCPFVAHTNGASDCVVDIEFVDENAPRKHHHAVDASSDDATREPEQVAVHPQQSVVVDTSQPVAHTPVRRVRSSSSSSDAKTKMLQRRLEAFFAGTLPSPPASIRGSRPSSAGSVRSLRSTTSSHSSSSSSSSNGTTATTRGRRRLDAVGKKATVETSRVKPILRSTSHSPKHRVPQTVQRTLLQLTLHTSPSGSSVSASTTAVKNGPSKITTRSRRPWRCRHCTFENNCFATSCSMCHQAPTHS